MSAAEPQAARPAVTNNGRRIRRVCLATGAMGPIALAATLLADHASFQRSWLFAFFTIVLMGIAVKFYRKTLD